ncbi:MAG: serine hydrolase [Bacteroidales bacterium]|nr:serine hydrolase [Bacteroidales bacterium]
MKRLFAIICLGLALAACDRRPAELRLEVVPPEEAGLDEARLRSVDSLILKGIEDGVMPGAVISVVKGDKIAFLKAYGNRQLVPDTLAMTTGTVFDLASLSKCVGTTLAVMQLVERGRLSLDDKVSKYIPGFEPWRDGGETEDINVRQLLTHSSGLSPYVNVETVAGRYGEPCPDSLMRYIAREVPRNFEPGTDFMYSCLNFVTLQNIVQSITGERLCDYVQREVFGRLGLEHCCYLPQERPEIMPLVAPTTVQADGLPLLGVVHDPLARRLNGGNSGNAGVFSDAYDLSVIAAAVMNGGAILGRRVLAPETVELMSKVPFENKQWVGRALGWDAESSHSSLKGSRSTPKRTLCHTGYTGTSMVIDMDRKLALILLTNRVHPEDDGSLRELRIELADLIW